MKPTLQLRIGQQLTLTPQLQMAIRLLQLSTVDLQQEIQQALESNPLLESQDDVDGSDEYLEHDAALDYETREEQLPSMEYEDAAEIDLQGSQLLADELPVDTSWDEVYQESVSASAAPETSSLDWQAKQGTSLHEHLTWQMELTAFSEIEKAIAIAIIDSIDEDGMLNASLEDICGSLGELRDKVSLNEVEAVLKAVQDFDPVGVGARNLQECLLLQLRQKPAETPRLKEALEMVEQYLHLLAKHDYNQIQRRMNLEQDALLEVVQLIQSLNPRPGSQITAEEATAIIPDVIVRKQERRWVVELNLDALPKLRINKHYAQLIQRANNDSDNVFLRNQLQEARWFLKSLQSRHETLLKVATCIVERQQGFLEYGPEAMKPMVLRDVAEALGVHESTISRVTTQKFMHTPQGVFELKYFFSSHVSSDSGQECSATAIRALIKKLIAAENSKKPLSDSKIAQILAEQGVNVARRTVAKYREAMAIPPSNERKYLS